MSSSSEESDFEDLKKLNCDLCCAVFSGVKPYEQHLKGSTHKKAVMKKKYKKKHNKAKKELMEGNATSGPQTNGDKPCESDDGINSDSDSGNVYTCVSCKKICSGHVSFRLHMEGRKHRKQMRKLKLMEEIEKDPTLATSKSNVEDVALYENVPQLKPYAKCSDCNKSFMSPEEYKNHMESSTHRKTCTYQKMSKELKDSNAEFRKPSDSDDDEDSKPYCSDCNKPFSGPVPYQQHMISNTHKKQLQNLKCQKKVKDLAVVDEDSGYKCKDCGAICSGPQSLKAHLKGQSHQKCLKKSKILDELKVQHPEVVEKPSVSDSDDHSLDDVGDSVLHCSTCSKSFSGAEPAKQHFMSKKHIKAVIDKKKIDKIRMMQGKKSTGKRVQNGEKVRVAKNESQEQSKKSSRNKNRSLSSTETGAKEPHAEVQRADTDEEFEKLYF